VSFVVTREIERKPMLSSWLKQGSHISYLRGGVFAPNDQEALIDHSSIDPSLEPDQRLRKDQPDSHSPHALQGNGAMNLMCRNR